MDKRYGDLQPDRLHRRPAPVFHRHSDPGRPDLKAVLAYQSGGRQIIDRTTDLVQSRCGFAAPLMPFAADHPILRARADEQRPGGLKTCWDTRNWRSLDGLPTGTGADL